MDGDAGTRESLAPLVLPFRSIASRGLARDPAGRSVCGQRQPAKHVMPLIPIGDTLVAVDPNRLSTRLERRISGDGGREESRRIPVLCAKTGRTFVDTNKHQNR